MPSSSPRGYPSGGSHGGPPRDAGHTPTSSSSGRALLTLRTAVILLLGACIGVAIGLLTFLAQQSVPACVVVGLVATGTSITGLNQIIDHNPS